MALVLCTGMDPVLTRTRQLILEQAGYSAVAATSERAIETACRDQRFDIALIDSTMDTSMKARAFRVIREHCPGAKIVELYFAYTSKALQGADAWLEMPLVNPQNLLETVAGLAAKRAAR